MLKKMAVFVGVISLILLVVGCQKSDDPLMNMKKEELVQMVKDQSAELAEKDDRIAELEDLVKALQGSKEAATSTISVLKDGRSTFNSIKGQIFLPENFEYPGSTQAPNTSSVNITNTLRLSITYNWMIRLSGTMLELEHSDGIYGIMKAGYIDEMQTPESLKLYMESFFEKIPKESIQYSKLFLEDQWWGMEAKVKTLIDQEEAYLRCGMIGFSNQSLIYMFCYSGERNDTKEEAIINILSSVKMFELPLRVE